ncbi:DUF6311 domain-containing protein [Pseudomonas sp. JUb52]|uniref:DUF6311 domain-containing protein n=1 Tax=Pseudomonas sp. JUb52 TaxID=2485127 RepID=UPI0010438724|nr:DUF6311 domain-containing protein [Pseudomonas sp. JUb52]TCQ88015.1 hypothetical protein EC839_106293 [Pseudomonas sp. JUb52]
MSDLKRTRGIAVGRDLAWATLLGVLAFLAILGPRVLNPANIGWLQAGDFAQYYLGWRFFEQAPWSFPVGLNPGFGLELGNSIVYTDSTPLLAIFFKLLSPLLPETFQYSGIWWLLCFILQAFFAWKIIGLFSRNLTIQIPGVMLFLFAPPFLWRLQCHVSLTGHFLVLAGIYLVLRRDQRHRILYWCLLFGTIGLVHAYFFPMVGALWAADLGWRTVKRTQTIRLAIVETIAVALTVLFCCWQAGYFAVQNGLSATGYGQLGLNLLSIFNSADTWAHSPTSRWSYVLQDLPEIPGNYEGFNYLGLGTIVLLILGIPTLVSGKVGLVSVVRRNPLLVLAMLALTLFAITNKVGIGSYSFQFPIGAHLERLANVFRASGRIFWPVYYMIIVMGLYLLVRGHTARVAAVLLVGVAVIQAADLNLFRKGMHGKMMEAPLTVWSTPLNSLFWDQAADRYKKIRSLAPMNQHDSWSVFAEYAIRHNLATDIVYLARMDQSALARAKSQAADSLALGNYLGDTLYILDDSQVYFAKRNLRSDDLLARVNNFYVIAPGWKSCKTCRLDDPEVVEVSEKNFGLQLGQTIKFIKGVPLSAYLAKGWSELESWGVWSNGPISEVELATATQPSRLILKLDAFISSITPVQRFSIEVNGHPAGDFEVADRSDNTVTVSVPTQAQRAIAENNIMKLTIKYKTAIVPKAVGISGEDRMLALGLRSLTLE